MFFQRLLIAAVCLVLAAGSASAQILEFDLRHQRAEAARPDRSAETGVTTNAPEPPKNIDEVVTVTLTPASIWVRGESDWKVYDFEAETITYADPAAQIYSVSDLHWLPAFRDFERMYRERDLRFAREQGFDVPDSPLEREMDLGGVTQEVATSIEFEEAGNERRFSSGGQEFSAYSRSDVTVPEPLIPVYRAYLLAEHQTHLLVKQMILEEGLLFQELDYRFRVEQFHDTDISFTLMDVRSEPSATLELPAGFQQQVADDDSIVALMDRVGTETPPSVDDYAAELERLNAAEQYAEGLLAFYEYTMQYGQQEMDRIRPLIQALMERAPRKSGGIDLQALSAAIRNQPETEQGLRDAIEVLQATKGKLASHGHVLNVYMANYQGFLEDRFGQIGQNAVAADLIIDALEENPFLTGAWHDLGWKYFYMFRMPEAWNAWDQARTVNPGHSLIEGIDNLEAQVKQHNPAFFLRDG